MGWWSKKPPPPVLLPTAFGWPTSPVQYIFWAVILAHWAWLIWARFFARRSTHVLDALRAWYYIPAVLVLMPLMHVAVHGMCEDIGVDLADTVPVNVTNKLVMIAQIAPVVVFPLTVGEGCLLLYLACKGPNGGQVSWFMHLVIASTLAVTLFYLLEASSGRCILVSTFDRPLEPLHYLMWTVTMVIDSVTLHMLMAIQRRMRGEEKLLNERNLAEVLLCTQALFFAAFYGNLLRPVSALNIILIGTAFTSFSTVLYRNYEVVQKATMDKVAVGEALALRFVFIRRALSIKWCYYSIVWMLSASDTISIQNEGLLLTALDLLKAMFAISAWALYL